MHEGPLQMAKERGEGGNRKVCKTEGESIREEEKRVLFLLLLLLLFSMFHWGPTEFSTMGKRK